MRPLVRCASIIMLSALLSTAAQAQLPVEDCTGADLDGGDTFPVGGFFIPSADDFTMTGTSCTEQGVDSVLCFTPTSSCDVNIDCENDSGTQSVNVFVGPCSAAPASCLASATGASASLTNFTLTAGQNVCVVCEYSDPSGLHGMTIAEVSGSCGALPVQLQSFDVGSAE